jgi:hypothetical protein
MALAMMAAWALVVARLRMWVSQQAQMKRAMWTSLVGAVRWVERGGGWGKVHDGVCDAHRGGFEGALPVR